MKIILNLGIQIKKYVLLYYIYNHKNQYKKIKRKSIHTVIIIIDTLLSLNRVNILWYSSENCAYLRILDSERSDECICIKY